MAYRQDFSSVKGRGLSDSAEEQAPQIDFNIPDPNDGNKPHTTKQLELILDIMRVTQHPYMGTTRQDAAEYIDEHLDDYRLMQEVSHERGA